MKNSSSGGNDMRAIKNAVLIFCILSFILTCGCDAFVRKFTRKSKKDSSVREEMVLVPQEYKSPLVTKDELYRQYFLYWKSWHDELLEALSPTTVRNYKKQISCAEQSIENLKQLSLLLKEERRNKLLGYIRQMQELKDAIVSDLYGNNTANNRLQAERIRRNVLRFFSADKIKDYLA
ncbi:MAG: hypothetical protein WC510_03685 [Candidatus Omnitrophota bacterium]